MRKLLLNVSTTKKSINNKTNEAEYCTRDSFITVADYLKLIRGTTQTRECQTLDLFALGQWHDLVLGGATFHGQPTVGPRVLISWPSPQLLFTSEPWISSKCGIYNNVSLMDLIGQANTNRSSRLAGSHVLLPKKQVCVQEESSSTQWRCGFINLKVPSTSLAVKLQKPSHWGIFLTTGR